MDDELKRLSERVAMSIGNALGQEYRCVDGVWWLFTAGKPMRELTADEVQWHTERRHSPFVESGISKDDPRWWDDPV